MYIVIRKLNNMRSIDQAGRKAAEGVGAIMKQTPGFKGYYVFDGGSGVGGSVSLFDNREAAEAANEKAIAWIKENLAGFYDGQPPEVIKGEVMAAVLGDQAQQPSGQEPHAGRDELLRRSVDEIVPEPERIGEGDHPMRDQVRKEATSSRSSS
jgi:hypothetical protein